MEPSFSAAIRLAALATLLSVTAAHGQLRVVTYNVAHLRGDEASLEAVFTALADDDRPGFATAPHVYVFQEVHSGDVGPLWGMLLAAAPAGIDYDLATYTNLGEDDFAGAQALFYRSDTLVEIAAAHEDIFTGAGRRADRWLLEHVEYGPATRLYVYGMHLKAGIDEDDEAQRLSGAQAVLADAATLPPGSHVVLAGDLNVQGHDEAAYEALIDDAVDPLGVRSWSGPTHAQKHTQSPRVASVNGLTGGGMDDRFDFQLVSVALVDAIGLDIMDQTYRALGNDGAHYNDDINDGNNFYYPADVPRSNALADALFAASDHLPVVLDYTIPARLDASMSDDLGRLIAGAAIAVPVDVANTAPVTTPLGTTSIAYTVIGSGALDGTCTGVAAPLAGPEPCLLALDTTGFGVVDGTALAFSSDPGVIDPAIALATTATIVRAARPSLDGTAVVTTASLALTVTAGSGPVPLDAMLWNIGFDDLQARLDLDAVEGVETPLLVTGPLPTGIGVDAAALPIAIDPMAAPPGVYELDLQLSVSDEDLPGETSALLTLHVHVTISADERCVADVDGDDTVGVDDLIAVVLTWGPCGGPTPCRADIDGNGVVDVDDLLLVILGWGACP